MPSGDEVKGAENGSNISVVVASLIAAATLAEFIVSAVATATVAVSVNASDSVEAGSFILDVAGFWSEVFDDFVSLDLVGSPDISVILDSV